MAKKGMKRRESNMKPKNTVSPVPEIQGKAKRGNTPANPVISETKEPLMKVYHAKAHFEEKPIASVYRAIDNDLARDNLENDITAADLQDM